MLGLVPLAVVLAPDQVGACQPYCPPGEPTHVDPDVPTDVGIQLVYDRCRSDRLSKGEVIDQSGALVPGFFDSSRGAWRPVEPLVPGGSYTLREITPAKDRPSFPFVANAGPAPVVAPDDLGLSASAEPFAGGSLCCQGSAPCNYDARCMGVTTAQTWRLSVTIGGEAPRWFQQTSFIDEAGVGKPKPKQPPPVVPLERGELCGRVSSVTAGGEAVSRSLCLTLGELPALPDRCAETLALYDSCDSPDAALTQFAKGCGAEDKGGCAVGPGPHGLSAPWGAGFPLAAVVLALLRRRLPAARVRKMVNDLS